MTAISDGMRVKHGTKVRFVLRAGNEILEDDIIPVETLGGAVTRVCIMYNSLAVSGGTRWAHPRTGYAIHRPRWTAELVDPFDELAEGQLCDCTTCTGETT